MKQYTVQPQPWSQRPNGQKKSKKSPKNYNNGVEKVSLYDRASKCWKEVSDAVTLRNIIMVITRLFVVLQG